MMNFFDKPFKLIQVTIMLIFIYSVVGASSVTAAKKKPPLHHIPSAVCSECHQEIYQQWQGSMHAQSTALKDPIHGAFYKMLIGDPRQEGMTHKKKPGKFPVCLQCHAPNAARDKKTKLDAMPAYSEGVNCVACHTMSSFKGVHGENGKMRLGVKAYNYDQDHLHGPNGAWHGSTPAPAPGSSSSEATVNPFPHVANADLFKQQSACLGCHDQRKNSHGVPVCQTGPELRTKGLDISCQSCHMPITNGFADHTMGGGHQPAMVKRGVAVSIAAESTGESSSKATVTLKNLLPHKFPTGAPFRNSYIKVTALDSQGNEIWSNYKKSAFQEDKKSVLMLKLADADGKPTMPPKAKQILGDSRLDSLEQREYVYQIKVAGVSVVRAELYYNLLWPKIRKKLGDKLPDSLKKSILVGRAEASIQ